MFNIIPHYDSHRIKFFGFNGCIRHSWVPWEKKGAAPLVTPGGVADPLDPIMDVVFDVDWVSVTSITSVL